MFVDPGTLWLFALASAAIIVVPGPTVTVIIANSLRSGQQAGLYNVLGTQIGLALMLLALSFGFSTVVNQLSWLFNWVRIAGAVYLIWLGIQLWRAKGGTLNDEDQTGSHKSSVAYVWQGFIVIWSNPKALFFFGAFLPQFVDSSKALMPQLMALGITFMLIGALLDGAYAVAAGKAGSWLTRQKVIWVERASGSFLLAGGVWLLLSRRA